MAHTGGFDEPTCAECHFGAPLNGDDGDVALRAPEAFAVGEAYRLEVRLRHPGMAAAGFQLAVRFAEGDRAGAQAGQLAPMDGRTAVTTDTATGVAYGHQTLAGAVPLEPGATRWVMEWTAPDTMAAVQVHVAANAANDDASEFGDFIFATHQRVPAGTGALTSAPTDGHILRTRSPGGSPEPRWRP